MVSAGFAGKAGGPRKSCWSRDLEGTPAFKSQYMLVFSTGMRRREKMLLSSVLVQIFHRCEPERKQEQSAVNSVNLVLLTHKNKDQTGKNGTDDQNVHI